MKKILLGGSPCTHWSIAQKNNRETEAEGIGWELFRNYLIAKEKFQPDFFLYENNKSAAQPIKDQISLELGVPLQYINSALVSAQNRQRFYAHNIPNVPQPEDRGVLLKDILETGTAWTDKAYCLTASYDGAVALNTIERKQRSMIAEPVAGRIVGRRINEQGRRDDYNENIEHIQRFETNDNPQKTNCVSTVTKDNMIAQPIEYDAKITENYIQYDISGKNYNSQDQRAYFDTGKHPALMASSTESKTGVLTSIMGAEKKPIQCYEVKNGLITIKDKQYPIKLADGYYIIRKLTVTECCRLQTLPDDYCKVVSASQGYKGLGNGWTAEVIIHILSHMNIPLDEEIIVLSMYDGIGTGRYCFDKMGYTNVKYHAYEIDKHAMQVAMSNYPDIIQHGDAFQVREDNWNLGK